LSQFDLAGEVNQPQAPPALLVYLYQTPQVSDNHRRIVEKALVKYYKAKVVFVGELKVPKGCINPVSGKVVSDSLLRYMARELNIKNAKHLLLTNQVISTKRTLNGRVFPDWTIMGYGQLGGDCCVVSTASIKSNIKERIEKVALHEIGHTLGLRHCEFNETCLMVDLKGKGHAIDKSSHFLCSDCKQKIKLPA
jgi:archaemetzincin